ncbi:hypothetical protein BJY01DRAFT_101475 [Aspergillus pseudoustus]|uniref:Uncharacterized protein n=1 Tax=Aspergillus pseudoustus TaxID=1810923 RepID=A0ABR4IXM2_9EURO
MSSYRQKGTAVSCPVQSSPVWYSTGIIRHAITAQMAIASILNSTRSIDRKVYPTSHGEAGIIMVRKKAFEGLGGPRTWAHGNKWRDNHVKETFSPGSLRMPSSIALDIPLFRGSWNPRCSSQVSLPISGIAISKTEICAEPHRAPTETSDFSPSSD